MGLKTSLSTGLHNIISNRPPKTERILSLFLITVISVMSVAMLVVMTEGLESDLNKQYIESHSQKAINLAHQIERFIDTRRIQLEDQSFNAVVVQTVMRPESNQGLIRDYFSSQTIIGKRYPQKLFDFKGEKIFCSSTINNDHLAIEDSFDIGSLSNQEISDRFGLLYNKQRGHSIQLTADKSFWEIALPIKYGQSVEGLLVTYIPTEEIERALNLNTILNIQIKASTTNGNTIVWGDDSNESWRIASAIGRDIELSYAKDMSSLDSSFDVAKNRLLISTLIIALIAIGFSMMLGRWFFVRPMEKLQSFADQLSEGADPHLEKTKRITIEIQELSDRITDMAKKIQRRERDLMKTNQTLKDNQDTLVQAEKMAGLGQVTAGVAHEINNPIGFIMNNLTMLEEYHAFLKPLTKELVALKDQLTDEEKARLSSELSTIQEIMQKEDLEFVLNDLDCITGESIAGAERVREITQALKGYAYSGEKSSLTDINDCIESTLKMVWNELKYNCKVEKVLGELPQVECMGGQINQVFMNLFVNASHAMEGSQGTLSIATTSEDGQIRIKVTDTGCGIKPEHLKHIFEPFFTTKEVGRGTGLGMSICYDIIKNHGGHICVDSEVGVGTTFYISLPIVHEGD